jgi:hypothetical protein
MYADARHVWVWECPHCQAQNEMESARSRDTCWKCGREVQISAMERGDV